MPRNNRHRVASKKVLVKASKKLRSQEEAKVDSRDEATWFGTRKGGQTTFYFINPSRLIGRLTHFFYGLRFSKQVGGKFVVIWSPPNATSAAFDDPPSYLLENIFDLNKYRAENGDDLVVFHGSREREKGWLNLEGPEFAAMRPNNFDRSYFAGGIETYATRYAFSQFSDEKKSNGQLLVEARDLFRAMPQTAEVQEVLKVALGRLGTESFTAIHVRRSDVGVWLQNALARYESGKITPDAFRFVVHNFVARVAPPEAYFTEIAAAIAEKRKIVFTADLPDAIIPFEKHFGAEHFVDLATLVEAKYPIQKAFCDFCILTKADRVVSTGSMFASTATQFGGSKLAGIALSSSVEELEKFAIEALAPHFAGEQKVREALLLEIARSYEARKVSRDGKQSDFANWLSAIRGNISAGSWNEAITRIDRAEAAIGPSAADALTELRIRPLFKLGRLSDAEAALLALAERDLEKALSILNALAAEADPAIIVGILQKLHLKLDLTKNMTRNTRFLLNVIERQIATKQRDGDGAAGSEFFRQIKKLASKLFNTTAAS